MEELLTFVLAVGDHWIALMGGAAVVGLSLFERVKRNLPTWVWIVLASGFVFVATFQAWQDQHYETEKVSAELSESSKREAGLKAEVEEKSQRIGMLEVSLHGQTINPKVTVTVPTPILRVVPGTDARPHPVLSVTNTQVSKNEAGMIEVMIALANTGDMEAEAKLVAFLRVSNLQQPIPIPVPPSMLIPQRKELRTTYPLPLIKDGIAQFLNGQLTVTIHLTADYEDQGQRMRYFFEGVVRPNLDHVDIRRSNRESLR